MREYKFRAWDGAKMHNVSSFDCARNPAFYFTPLKNIDEYGTPHNGTPINRIECTGFVIMQFTGLKDKNGTDIYENDIVKWDDGSKGEYWRVAIVFYDSEQAMFSFRIIKNTLYELSCEEGDVFGGNFYYRDGSQLEVIGNQHQNPELIKQ